jgi:hypothetical protein
MSTALLLHNIVLTKITLWFHPQSLYHLDIHWSTQVWPNLASAFNCAHDDMKNDVRPECCITKVNKTICFMYIVKLRVFWWSKYPKTLENNCWPTHEHCLASTSHGTHTNYLMISSTVPLSSWHPLINPCLTKSGICLQLCTWWHDKWC